MRLHSFSKGSGDSGDAHLLLFTVAIVASVVLHIVLGYATKEKRFAFLRALPGMSASERLAIRSDSAARVDLPPDIRKDPEAVLDPVSGLDRPSVEDPVELLAAAGSDSSATLFEPPALEPSVGNTLAEGLTPPVEAPDPQDLVPWQPREEVLEIASRFANDELLAIPRREVPAVERSAGTPDVTTAFNPSVAVEMAARQGAPTYVPPAPPAVEMASGDAAASAPETAVIEGVEAGPVASGEEAASFLREDPKDVAPGEKLDDVLTVGLDVFRPAKPDGFAYFRVQVSRKDAFALPPIPRDVLFVQDASSSIDPRRLKVCTDALADVIRTKLLPGDRFNVLAFNTDKQFAFGPSWAVPTEENIAKGVSFLNGLEAFGRTDLYNAFQSVLDLPREKGRSTIVFLVSDGKPNAGDVSRDSEIIGAFSHRNGGHLAVFDAGLSSKTSNEYLLSMLSFCNRGGSAAISKDRFEIGETIQSLYGSVGTPVLTDIHFVFDSVSGATVTPETTGHLYLDRPLCLYGRVPAAAREVTFEALGFNGGRKYDMVFNLDLGNMPPGSGDSDIAALWAKTRIYDLVAAYARNPNPAYVEEMRAIGAAHCIAIPFGKRFQ